MPLSGGSETRGGAVDRHEERGPHFLAALRAMRPQEMHLLAADLVQGLEPSRQAAAELRETLGDAGAAGYVQDHLAGEPVLLLDLREYGLAQRLVFDEACVFTSDRQIHLRER